MTLSGKLELYIKHLAWLHAVPEKSGSGKRRVDELGNGLISSMPRVTGGEHIITSLLELGITGVTYQEIQSYIATTGLALDHWSVTTIKKLSNTYMVQAAKSIKRDCPPPYAPERKGDAVEVGRSVTEKFKALAKRRAKK